MMFICLSFASKALCQTASNAAEMSRKQAWDTLFFAQDALIWMNSSWLVVLSLGRYAACFSVMILLSSICLRILWWMTDSQILDKVGKMLIGLQLLLSVFVPLGAVHILRQPK